MAVATSAPLRELQEREGHSKPQVSIWLTGLKETVAELPAFVKLAAEIGVKEVYLQRLVFFDQSAIGKARPDQALFERLTREEAAYLKQAEGILRANVSRAMIDSAASSGLPPAARSLASATKMLPTFS